MSSMQEELRKYLASLGFYELDEELKFLAFAFDVNHQSVFGNKFRHTIYLAVSIELNQFIVEIMCFEKFKNSIIQPQKFNDFEDIKKTLESNKFLCELLGTNKVGIS
jgi:hypothetical protein